MVAVFNSKLGPSAKFLHAHLVTVVKKTLQASSAGSRVSPLYSALVKLHSAYRKQTPLHDSIFTHAECSVVLFDLLRGRLFSLSYGEGTHPPHVTSSLGHAAFPTNSREHMLDGVIIEEAVYDQLSGDHHVVLGSPGLWCVTCTAKLADPSILSPHTAISRPPHDRMILRHMQQLHSLPHLFRRARCRARGRAGCLAVRCLLDNGARRICYRRSGRP